MILIPKNVQIIILNINTGLIMLFLWRSDIPFISQKNFYKFFPLKIKLIKYLVVLSNNINQLSVYIYIYIYINNT
jgi:hypothetical protein